MIFCFAAVLYDTSGAQDITEMKKKENYPDL